jgi:UDP-N-acetylmuramoyl-tripeptide--D-alanyl-D-alanine ligase
LAARLGLDYIFAIGPLSRNITEIFGNQGFHFENNDELTKHLVEFVEKGDLILFKGSRGMALEEVVNALTN